MLVLFETAAGYAIFKVLDESKLQEVDSLWKEFETPEKANKVVKLKHWEIPGHNRGLGSGHGHDGREDGEESEEGPEESGG
ncbi:unnamed protein product [Oncorhynchus mykiss]|uniref:Nucleolar protein 58/56 N-terminal domain-containing protein n=1 Tax=Oncorhynchus mykiss TaxID=8022 RepID=A0A060W862_ONCMY|nr:unnamed protein product [Oncorhynchus mykiss]